MAPRCPAARAARRAAPRRRTRYCSSERARLGIRSVSIGKHEQLVPEDVSAVGLAVQTAGGDARIEVRGVG